MKKTSNSLISKIDGDTTIFFMLLIWLITTFKLYGKFWTITMIFGIPLPMSDYYSIPGDILPNDWMFWSSAIFGIINLGIIGFLFKNRFIKNKIKKEDKFYYKSIIGIGLGCYILFHIINPWYTLQMYPRLFMYQDGKNITNKEIYFYLTEKFGFKGDLYKPFKTIDDSIVALEFAKKIKEPVLYKYVYYDIEKYGYDKILEKYKDKTFQAYFLRNLITTDYLNDEKKLDFFKNNILFLKKLSVITDDKLVTFISSEIVDKYKKITNKNNKEIIDFIKSIDNDYLKKSWEIKGVDRDVFEY